MHVTSQKNINPLKAEMIIGYDYRRTITTIKLSAR